MKSFQLLFNKYDWYAHSINRWRHTVRVQVRNSSSTTSPLVLVESPTRLLYHTLTAHFAFPVIIFGKQIWCTQLSHHASLPWRAEGWGAARLMVLQPLPLRLLRYSSVPGATNPFLMNELRLFCAWRCTSLQVLHLVSSLTLHGQGWLLSWKHGSGF